MIYFLSAMILISGIAYLFAINGDKPFWRYLLKPGTMLFIILLAITGFKEPSLYVTWVVLGLIFSVGGDIFLMLPSDKFLYGLTSFLIAHICYIVAFTNGFQDFHWQLAVLLPVFLIGIAYYLFLFNSLKKDGPALQIGVLFYITVICFMFTQSFAAGSQLAIIGSLSFLVSDGILAFNQFYKPFKNAHHYVMITYYLAQYLIALSLLV